MQKKNAILITVIGAMTLTACGSKTDPTEKNFAAAVETYLEKKGELCLGALVWPVDMSASQLALKSPLSDAGKLAALEAAGLVKSEDAVVEEKSIIPPQRIYKVPVKRYTLTDAAKPFSKEKETVFMRADGQGRKMATDLCWGNLALDEVKKWEGPMKFGDYQEARVFYTYKINGLADWANRKDIQDAYPSIKRTLEGVGSQESKHVVKLTSNGWEPKGLD